jgi:hypothetical protein
MGDEQVLLPCSFRACCTEANQLANGTGQSQQRSGAASHRKALPLPSSGIRGRESAASPLFVGKLLLKKNAIDRMQCGLPPCLSPNRRRVSIRKSASN